MRKSTGDATHLRISLDCRALADSRIDHDDLELAARYAPDRVSNLMTVSGVQQVMLKVRFAEMSRGVSKSLQSSLRINGTDAQAGVGRGIAGVPNLIVMMIAKSLKSQGFVDEVFCWQWSYYFLSAEGVKFLVETLGLPEDVVPATYKKTKMNKTAGDAKEGKEGEEEEREEQRKKREEEERGRRERKKREEEGREEQRKNKTENGIY